MVILPNTKLIDLDPSLWEFTSGQGHLYLFPKHRWLGKPNRKPYPHYIHIVHLNGTWGTKNPARAPHRQNSSCRRIQNLPGELLQFLEGHFEAATPLVIGYILWMGQRNPAPVDRWFIPVIGIKPSKVAQDFATIHCSNGQSNICRSV